MFEMLLVLFLVAFAIFGVAEGVHFLVARLLKPKQLPNTRLLVTLDPECPEEQILSLLFEYRWQGERFAKEIVFLTDKLTDTVALKLKAAYKSDIADFISGVSYGTGKEKRIVQRNG